MTSALLYLTLPYLVDASTANSVLAAIFGECHCEDTFSCSSTIDANGGIVVWLLVMLYMFKALGTVCDEYFVPSLEMISEKLELSNDVAGATFMAAGSSAPELFTSLVATFLIVNEGGVGAIIGSAIFNILVIVGATCLFAGQELMIWWYPLARDCTFYVMAIILLCLTLLDSKVEWWEGLVMFLTYFLYIIYMKFNSKIAEKMGGAPTDVEATDDCEAQKTSADATEKTVEKTEQGAGPRVAASQPDVEPASQPDAPPVQPKAQTGNPNSPDDEDGAPPENTASPKPQEAAAEATSSQAVNRNQLHAPAGGDGTGSRNNSPREDGQHSHAIWSMHELKEDHKHHSTEEHHEGDQSGADGKDTDGKAGAETEEEEAEGRQCPDPLNFIWAHTMPSPERYWSLFFSVHSHDRRMHVFDGGCCESHWLQSRNFTPYHGSYFSSCRNFCPRRSWINRSRKARRGRYGSCKRPWLQRV